MFVNNMSFVVDKLKESDWFVIGDYKKMKDSTLIFTSFAGSFQLLLGHGYHLSLDIDNNTGRCYSFYALLNALKFIPANLTISRSNKAKLYFVFDDKLTNISGCHYVPFNESCYWDYSNRILAVGDINEKGDIIEFATNTYAKVNSNNLLAIYIKLQFDIIRK